MAITQLVIGALTVILGIATAAAIGHYSWMGDSGSGIWGGIVITVTGVIGVISAWKWENRCLEGVYLVFSIISTVISGITGIIYIIAVAWYSAHKLCTLGRGWSVKCRTSTDAVGLHVVLMLLAITEFFISIIASCINCANSCCGNNRNTTVIVHPQPQVAMVTTTNRASPSVPITYYQQPMGVQPQMQPHLQPPLNTSYQQNPQQTNPSYPPLPPPTNSPHHP